MTKQCWWDDRSAIVASVIVASVGGGQSSSWTVGSSTVNSCIRGDLLLPERNSRLGGLIAPSEWLGTLPWGHEVQKWGLLMRASIVIFTQAEAMAHANLALLLCLALVGAAAAEGVAQSPLPEAPYPGGC